MNYAATGDEQAYNSAILNLIALPFGVLLGKAMELLMGKLSGAVYGWIVITSLDDAGRAIVNRLLANGYSKELILSIIKRSGKQALTATESLISELEGLGISRTFIETTGNSLGYEGLAAAKSLLQAGKATESELLNLVNAGYNLDDILVLANKNILLSELAQYGITNSLEAGVAGNLVKAGYSSEVIAELSQYGIKPSSYLSRGIKTPELAETVVEAVSYIDRGLIDISFTGKIEKTAEELNAFWKSNGYVNTIQNRYTWLPNKFN